MKRKSRRAQLEQFAKANEGAAWIILSQPQHYPGLPTDWAALWSRTHGTPKRQDDAFMYGEASDDSLEGRYEKREKARVAAKRRRWLLREWRVSKKGNPYTKVRGGLHVVVYFRANGGWHFRVTDNITEEAHLSEQGYDGIDAAKGASFDAVLYMQSRRRSAHPAMINRSKVELCGKPSTDQNTA